MTNQENNMRVSFDGVFGEITTLPGCSQVAVSHGVFLPPYMRGRGIGKKAMRSRLQFIFDELGYDACMCTVESSNKPQIKLMDYFGWVQTGSFTSRKTGHIVRTYLISASEFSDRVKTILAEEMT